LTLGSILDATKGCARILKAKTVTGPACGARMGRRSAWRRIVSIVLAAGIAAAPVVCVAQQRLPADHDEESERDGAIAIEEVNRLVALGAIRPLSEVLAAAQKRFPGELIDVNLLRRHGRYVYEIEILRGGRRVEVYVDAATLQLRGQE
jgi:uncharacterized membrane protein YkoI